MQQLQKSIRSDGSKRAVPPSKKIAELNASQQPNIVTNPDVHEWLNAKDDVYGDDILRLHPDSPHNVHFPFRRGDINVHSDVGGSQTAVLHDLESIWSYAVESLLRIPRNEFCHYKAVVVIPALYNRSFVKHYMSLALKQLGFSHAFVLQDHVAATFGAGLGTDSFLISITFLILLSEIHLLIAIFIKGYACVVDVGDQKTTISCVEDGISHPNTRIQLSYGGSDITQVRIKAHSMEITEILSHTFLTESFVKTKVLLRSY